MERWTSDAWQAEVTDWVDGHVSFTGPLEQVRIRPWGVVLSAPTPNGTVFMKAAAPGTAFEPALYDVLATVVPDRVLHPIALDVDRGWLLLPDGGPVLADQHEGEPLLAALAGVVGQYAQMQLDLVPHVDALLAAGLTDMAPTRMQERFDEAVSAVRPATPEEADRLQQVVALGPVVEAWCERLAAAPGVPTLDHNDLHGSNVFLSASGQARFFDWGDAVISHPFASALVLRSVARWVLDVHEETPIERRLVDAYLEPFTGLAPRSELAPLVDVACELGKIARSLVWARALVDLPADAEDPDGFRGAPLGWLLQLLDGPSATEAGA